MTGTIGIISGSGPEAGLDLHAKVLVARRDALGRAYRGDIDAPRVVTVSEPRLGLSMDLGANHREVWSALEATARQLAPQVDVFAIACNTLNVFVDRLAVLDLPAEIIDVATVTRHFADRRGVGRLGLLGAEPVTDLGEWSAYRSLASELELVGPPDAVRLHRLIHDIKLAGGGTPAASQELAEIIEAMAVEPVLLACTELPLVDLPAGGAEVVDVTRLVAEALAAHAT